jgi:hypothetical protein
MIKQLNILSNLDYSNKLEPYLSQIPEFFLLIVSIPKHLLQTYYKQIIYWYIIIPYCVLYSYYL